MKLLFHPVLQNPLRRQAVGPQCDIAMGPRPVTLAKIGVSHQQRQDAAGARSLLAGPQRVPEAVGFPVRVVERDAALPKRRHHRLQHVRACSQEHHRLALPQMLLGALEDEVLGGLVGPGREPVDRALLRPRQVNLLLASRDLPDQFVRDAMHGARHAKRLLQDDFVVVRNVRVEDGVRRGARE